MAAKRKRSQRGKKKKQVTVQLDADVVRKLAKALELLAGMAGVVEVAGGEGPVRRALPKKKKGARSRRKK